MMIKHAVDQCTYIIVFLLFLFCYPLLEPIDIDIVLIIIFKILFLILIYKNKKNKKINVFQKYKNKWTQRCCGWPRVFKKFKFFYSKLIF